MNKELEEKLFTDFPKLYPRDKSLSDSLMHFGFECGDGWYDLIRELSEKINPSATDRIYAVQVKEKFGALRFYMSFHTEEINEIIREYEEKSVITCEECGKPGRLNKGPWYNTYCEEHRN